ncbi:TonB-dependent receptor [Fibrella aestuarina BUZ 2]|uniref:TonB-dependent receptor n=1 Tax=Fibrella aestuarina BUZ 2 TaxID=1166018 RepID=I0KCK6_9BACT|nr:TonB-dependent receptor [Fibrella aestuarina]CCH01859.1 TonB-dependent receptor [Fibrella aestuarina BUZ 2]
MRLRLLTSLLLLTCLRPASAQQLRPVRIALVDASRQAIPGAAVRLTNRADSTQRVNAIADTAGIASVSLRMSTPYDLLVTAVGMKSLQRVVRFTPEQPNLRLTLDTNTKSLDAVTITAKKPLLRQEDDKLIVDPTPIADISTNAFELLERTPGLFLDQDGNVYLSSATPATIYINGREQKMSTADIASLLKSLPPGSIERLEVMRTPSARYDASGSGGAVNIVLKKGVKLGRTGAITASANQGRFGNQGVGINLNESDGGRTKYLNLNYNRRQTYELLTTKRQLTGGRTIGQEAYTRFPGEGFFAGYGLGYELSPKWNLNFDGRLSYGLNNSTASNQTAIRQLETAATVSANSNDLQNQNTAFNLSQDVSAKRKIDSLGSEWTIDASYTYLRGNGSQTYLTQYQLPVASPLAGAGDIDTRRHMAQFQTDLRLKWPYRITFEAGLKSALQQFTSQTAFSTTTNGQTRPDPFRTNTFDYNEAIHAAYAQASKGLPGGFLLKAGLRAENTNMDGHQRVPSDTTFRVRRTDLFPYVYLTRPLTKISGFELKGSLIYRRSIARPTYDNLNPFARYIDPYLYETGNPGLQPQFTETYEANISVDDFPLFAIGRNHIQNIFTNVLYQDPRNPAVSYRTFDNLGQNRETYFRMVAGMPPVGKYFFVLVAQYNLTDYDGRYENQPLTFSRASWRFFTYQQLRLGTRSTLTLNAFYLRGGQQQFYALGDFGNVNLSINRLFLNRKLTVALNVTDLFYTNRNTFTLNQGNIAAVGDRRADTRRVGLNLRYNFGIRKREERSNPFNVPTE